jgi:hypothetical protein
MSTNVSPSEQALIALWDYIDEIRLRQSEPHAAIVARAAHEAALRTKGTTMQTRFKAELPAGNDQIIQALEAVIAMLRQQQPPQQEAAKAAKPVAGSGEHMKALISGALDAAARNGGIR